MYLNTRGGGVGGVIGCGVGSGVGSGIGVDGFVGGDLKIILTLR